MMFRAGITTYSKLACSQCGTHGATVYGLCLQCTKNRSKQSEEKKSTPCSLVNTWVKRGATHTIEHYVTSQENNLLSFACGKFVRAGVAAPGNGLCGHHRCGPCSDAIGVKYEDE
jgi:hypothetical protein